MYCSMWSGGKNQNEEDEIRNCEEYIKYVVNTLNLNKLNYKIARNNRKKRLQEEYFS